MIQSRDIIFTIKILRKTRKQNTSRNFQKIEITPRIFITIPEGKFYYFFKMAVQDFSQPSMKCHILFSFRIIPTAIQ